LEFPDRSSDVGVGVGVGVGKGESLQVELQKRTLAVAQKQLQLGVVDLVIVFPEGFSAKLAEFRARILNRDTADASTPWTLPSPMIYHNSASEKSQISHSRISRVLERWNEEIGAKNLRDSKMPLLAAKPFSLELSDVAEAGRRDAAIWSKVLPFVLLIWALTGAFYPAIDLCAGEKERGTLETLLSSPAERSEIVWGKLLTVMLFSVATSTLNLASMAATGSFVVAQLSNLNMMPAGGSLGLPPLDAIIWLAMALFPVSALFSALCLALAAMARSTKEGQYYLMPLVMTTMPLMILPMAPGVELTLGNSLIPITGVVLLLRTMLEGSYLLGLKYMVPVMAVTLFCCLFAIRWAVDQFNRESVLFRESERFELALWLRHLVRDRRPTPSVGAAIFGFVVIMIISFFISVSLAQPTNVVQLSQLVFISQVVVIALPALLMTLLLTNRPFDTLLLSRRPVWITLPAAVALAVSLHPLGIYASSLIQKLYPIAPEAAEQLGQFSALLDSAPLWLPLCLIALLPAVCEELAFRGFILSGLRHIGDKWRAIAISSVFFGVTHGILQQSVSASLLGLVLGYIAIQTGSLYPCILFHATYNSLALLFSKIELSADRFAGNPMLPWILRRSEEMGHAQYAYTPILLVASGLVAVYLLGWLHRLPYQKSSEEELEEAIRRQNWALGRDELVAAND
ncbi:MAG: CPBP family intramembrane metalloprotease, partial [Planctomycetales bacterium]|nr:CPBP family intramembrane metalloprotease [Planctomycetales bacterium]